MTSPVRRSTSTVIVGAVPVGSAHPIVVQSMTNTDTADADATAIQVAQLAHAGSELVRITVNNDQAAAAVPSIREKLDRLGVDVPLIGDFHYNGHLLLTKYPEMAAALAKYRINPGNVGTKRRDEQFVQIIAEPSAELSGIEAKQQAVDAVGHVRPLSRLRALASATSSTSRAASADATRWPNFVIR